MINVVPLDDLRNHTYNTTCECEPKVTIINGGMLIRHWSFDGREYVEKFKEILNYEDQSCGGWIMEETNGND